MIERAASAAGLEFKAHPHMLRYALANKGHDIRAIQGWLGHRSITSTAVYTSWRRIGSRISGGSDKREWHVACMICGARSALPAPDRHRPQLQGVRLELGPLGRRARPLPRAPTLKTRP
jgi:Phage integrase family